MKYLIALVLLSSCINLKPTTVHKLRYYVYKDKGYTIVKTVDKLTTVTNDTIKVK